jgi:hypothetical protein
MNDRTAAPASSRLAGLSLAFVLTLAMLSGIDALAQPRTDAPQMVQQSTTPARG